MTGTRMMIRMIIQRPGIRQIYSAFKSHVALLKPRKIGSEKVLIRHPHAAPEMLILTRARLAI